MVIFCMNCLGLCSLVLQENSYEKSCGTIILFGEVASNFPHGWSRSLLKYDDVRLSMGENY